MSMKCSVFIAASLDGFIARNNGDIDWLMKANALVPPGEDGGYQAFIETVDGLVMGSRSFEKVLSFEPWPYHNLPVFVLSHQDIEIPEHLKSTVSITSEPPVKMIARLSRQGFKHLYIDGGLTIQSFLIDNLIDELTITVIPVLLGSGRSLFGTLPYDITLQHMQTRTIKGGLVQMKYKVNQAGK